MPHRKFGFLLTDTDHSRAQLIRTAQELGVPIHDESVMWLENYELKHQVIELRNLVDALHCEIEKLNDEISDAHYTVDDGAQ